MTEQADWAAALRHAVRVFGIAPAAFWRLSVAEWRALNGGEARALGADELAGLMGAFPDAPSGESQSSPHPPLRGDFSP